MFDWVNRLRGTKRKPPLPDYPEIVEAFRPEYEKMCQFFHDMLRPLLMEGHLDAEYVSAHSQRWKMIVNAMVDRLGEYDRSSPPQTIKAIDDLMNAAKTVGARQIQQESAEITPEKPLTTEQLNDAINTLNVLFNTHIWPDASLAKGQGI